MKIYFIGAGPGDPELITLKGLNILKQADIVIWAGSLVNPEILTYCRDEVETFDSAGLNYDEVIAIYKKNSEFDGIIARIHTGDPSIYGAIQEQIDFCRKEKIDWEVIPGVSSFQAAAAVLGQELTLPQVSQTVILSRAAGRTPVPEKESIEKLAALKASLILFLSVSQIEKLTEKLAESYGADAPCAVVYRASWPDQKIVRGRLNDIAHRVKAEGITKQALIVVGEVLRAQDEPLFYEKSKLYDPDFSHGCRDAVDEAAGSKTDSKGSRGIS
ncbi:MAG TPA: precorrin-4 C(11)-methyltransferase [Spirochaeta sp.]|nr:precorrin-4 C(11)-methyltransferase [Spirochaeta sp.]